MRLTSKIGLAVALLLIAIGGFLFFSRKNELPPETLIQQSLQSAEDGARKRSARQIMEVISDDFQAGMWDKKRLYLQVIRGLRDGRGTDFNAHISQPKIFPSPNGKRDERLVYSRLSVFENGSGDDIWGTGTLALIMRKEWRSRFLIFREPYWRVVSVVNLPPAVESSLSGL